MNVEAQFSWQAPAEFFFLSSPEGSPEEIRGMIEKDVATFLSASPSLESLEERYNIVGATRFLVDEQPLPAKCLADDIPGRNLYRLRVRSRGRLFSDRSPLEMSTWDQNEMWDEIEEFSTLPHNPEIAVSVEFIG